MMSIRCAKSISRAIRSLALAALGATLVPAGVPAWADKPDQGALKSIDPPGTASSGVSFFGGVAGSQDQFSGRLLCLRSDRRFEPTGPGEECPSAGGRRVYALSIESGSLVRPVLAGNEQVSRQLDDFLGRQVILSGKDYPASGMIVANAIHAQD
jgi:hypothetical protein